MKRYVKKRGKQFNISSRRIPCYKIRKFFYVTFHFDTIARLHWAFAKYIFFHLNNTNNYKRWKDIYKKFGIYKFWYLRIENSRYKFENFVTITLFFFTKYTFISIIIIINDEKNIYKNIYSSRHDWNVGQMKKTALHSRIRNFRTRLPPPSDVPNFQKKVRAFSCYTVVPLCRKQSIKEVSLY